LLLTKISSSIAIFKVDKKFEVKIPVLLTDAPVFLTLQSIKVVTL